MRPGHEGGAEASALKQAGFHRTIGIKEGPDGWGLGEECCPV